MKGGTNGVRRVEGIGSPSTKTAYPGVPLDIRTGVLSTQCIRLEKWPLYSKI